MPWTGYFTGIVIGSIWYWCADQVNKKNLLFININLVWFILRDPGVPITCLYYHCAQFRKRWSKLDDLVIA